MEIDAVERIKVNAKYLKVHLKVADHFCAALESATGTQLCDYEDYVPGFMPGEHYGDYVILDIDIDTGHIVNWRPPTKEQIEAFIDGKSSKD